MNSHVLSFDQFDTNAYTTKILSLWKNGGGSTAGLESPTFFLFYYISSKD